MGGAVRGRSKGGGDWSQTLVVLVAVGGEGDVSAASAVAFCLAA